MGLNSAFVVAILPALIIHSCNQTKKTQRDVADCLFQVQQINTTVKLSVANKTDVTVVNQMITNVQKEIANLQETIGAFYASRKTVTFSKEDVGTRIKYLKNEGDPCGIFIFALDEIPLVNSVSVYDRASGKSPDQVRQLDNLLLFNATFLPGGPDELFRKTDKIVVEYTPDLRRSGQLLNLSDFKYKLDGNTIHYEAIMKFYSTDKDKTSP